MALLNLQAEAAGLSRSDGASLTRYATEMLHYFHGVNPMGLVLLSNMYGAGAERSVDELYHGWFYHGTPYDNARTSPLGPAPGYVTGGPNADYANVRNADTRLVPPTGQPAQKSYLDENDAQRPEGGDNAIYAINEPAIYYQSAYVRLLSALMAAEGALPAEVTRFDAELQGTTVKVSWDVAAEVNVARYLVQRSADAAAFSDLGAVASLGAGSTYRYTDAAPLPNTSYYRLAIEDTDGSVAFSDVRSVRIETSDTTGAPFGKTGLSPNPARGSVTLTLATVPAGTSLQIIDASGRVLHTEALASARQEVDLTGLASGVYTVSVRAPGGSVDLPLWVR